MSEFLSISKLIEHLQPLLNEKSKQIDVYFEEFMKNKFERFNVIPLLFVIDGKKISNLEVWKLCPHLHYITNIKPITTQKGLHVMKIKVQKSNQGEYSKVKNIIIIVVVMLTALLTASSITDELKGHLYCKTWDIFYETINSSWNFFPAYVNFMDLMKIENRTYPECDRSLEIIWKTLWNEFNELHKYDEEEYFEKQVLHSYFIIIKKNKYV